MTGSSPGGGDRGRGAFPLLVAGAALLTTAAIVGVLAAVGVFGTAGDGASPAQDRACVTGSGEAATVYSSLPHQGFARRQSRAIVRGISLALDEAGGEAGGCTIEHVRLDDSLAQVGSWAPRKTARNARRAARDPSTIAYIGEFNSGATAISLPILNRARVLQISPSNTAIGLTDTGPGTAPGEPERYYPTGVRTFARVSANDRVQGGALAALARDEGCGSVFLVEDGELYGYAIIEAVRAAAGGAGLDLVGRVRIRRRARSYRSQAREIGTADCMIFGGITANNAVEFFESVAAADREVKLFAADGVAESAFADPRDGGISRATARRTKVTVGTLAPDAYPPAGQAFFERYRARYPRKIDPYAIHGYEAMSLALDVIERGSNSGGGRAALLDALFATEDRASVLGTYDINRNGDPTIRDYGVYTIRNGRLRFDRKIESLLGP